MSDTSGPMSCKPFAKWDPDSQCWKTSEATSLWALTLSSLTLPAWGGLHDGELCEHPTPELATNGPDYSSLPTPTRADYRSVNSNPGARNEGSGVMPASEHSLPAKIAALLPTPAVNDMGEGKTLEWWDDWAPRQKSSDGRPAPHGRSLAIEAQRLLPTPSAADGMGGHASRSGDRSDELLLPGLVKTFLPTPKATNNENRQSLDRYGMNLGMALQSLGETTDQPSPDGSASSDDQPHRQLSLDGLALPA